MEDSTPDRRRHRGLIFINHLKLVAARIKTSTKTMSTRNFDCKNTSKIYAIDNDEEFAQYDCQESLECLDWTPCDECDGDRSYPASIIAEKTKCLCYAGASIDITAQAKIVAGYYSGACFDFDCRLVVYDRDGYRVSDFDDLDDINKYMDEEAIKEDDWTGNKGLSVIHAQRIIAKIQATIDELKEEAEKAFADSCDDCLACVAVFSNGEAIYKRA